MWIWIWGCGERTGSAQREWEAGRGVVVGVEFEWSEGWDCPSGELEAAAPIEMGQVAYGGEEDDLLIPLVPLVPLDLVGVHVALEGPAAFYHGRAFPGACREEP